MIIVTIMTESNIKILMNTCTFINSPLMVTYHIMDNGGVLVNSLGFKILPKINIIFCFLSIERQFQLGRCYISRSNVS